jgi:hypothetical protein
LKFKELSAGFEASPGAWTSYLRVQEFFSVADPGFLSRILIFTHPGSRIPDPGPKTGKKKRGEKKISCHTIFYNHKFHKIGNYFIFEMLKKKICSVADPDPGSGIGCFFDPGIRDGRKSASGSGIRDEQPGSYFLELRNHFYAFLGLKYLNSLMRIRDPGWKKVGSGIRDKHPGSATLKIWANFQRLSEIFT